MGRICDVLPAKNNMRKFVILAVDIKNKKNIVLNTGNMEYG